jgi:hypothetical protein
MNNNLMERGKRQLKFHTIQTFLNEYGIELED